MCPNCWDDCDDECTPTDEDFAILQRQAQAEDAPSDPRKRARLLEHYLGKTAARLGLADQARRVNHFANLDEIEAVGEAVLAELEAKLDGRSTR